MRFLILSLLLCVGSAALAASKPEGPRVGRVRFNPRVEMKGADGITWATLRDGSETNRRICGLPPGDSSLRPYQQPSAAAGTESVRRPHWSLDCCDWRQCDLVRGRRNPGWQGLAKAQATEAAFSAGVAPPLGTGVPLRGQRLVSVARQMLGWKQG